MASLDNLLKHVGKVNNTGTRVVVVFRKIPDDESNCLVIETDRLPDRYHDNIMEIVKSKEAQATTELYEVLTRRVFQDGSNVLQTLHLNSFLKKMPVNTITLFPLPNHPLPLELANKQIDNPNNEVMRITSSDVVPPQAKATTANAKLPDQNTTIAKGLLEQAKLLEMDAEKKRQEAYKLDPSLKRPGRPSSADKEKLSQLEALVNNKAE